MHNERLTVTIQIHIPKEVELHPEVSSLISEIVNAGGLQNTPEQVQGNLRKGCTYTIQQNLELGWTRPTSLLRVADLLGHPKFDRAWMRINTDEVLTWQERTVDAMNWARAWAKLLLGKKRR